MHGRLCVTGQAGKLGHIGSKEMGKVCAITDEPFEETKEERWEDVRARRMQEGATWREVLTPLRKE